MHSNYLKRNNIDNYIAYADISIQINLHNEKNISLFFNG